MSEPRADSLQKNSEALRQGLGALAQKVVRKLNLDPDFLKTNPSEQCRLINGHIVEAIVNEGLNGQKLPAMVYTMQPLEKDYFTEKSWTFHSVGIVEIGNGQYAAFDWTNSMKQQDKKGERFLAIGSLKTVSDELKSRFGLNWDLQFESAADKNKSVKGRLENAREIIKSGQTINYNRDIVHVGAESSAMKKPLGIKYTPPNDKPLPVPLQDRFTYSYA